MKNLKHYFLSTLLAITSLALTSCEEDYDIAYDLSGYWHGEVAQDYFSGRYGYDTQYTDAEFHFIQTGGRFDNGGYGEEIDYYYDRYRGRWYPSDRIRFTWEVRDRVIRLVYADGAFIEIWNYTLGRSYFSGEFHDARTGERLARFRMEKTADQYYNNYGYYSKEKTTDPQAE